MTQPKLCLPLTGGCQCGSIRYQISSPPEALYACYCTECQRQSASAFGMSMPVQRGDFKIDSGEPTIWRRKSASGRTVECASCGHCGTRLYHAPERNPRIINIKPGTLDDTGWLKPVAHLWTSSAQAWTEIPNDVLQFSGQPDSFEPIFDHWHAYLAKVEIKKC